MAGKEFNVTVGSYSKFIMILQLGLLPQITGIDKCVRIMHCYAEGGATEAYCNRAVCPSVRPSVCPSVTSISRRSLKTKR